MVKPYRPHVTIKYGAEKSRFAYRITEVKIRNAIVKFNTYCKYFIIQLMHSIIRFIGLLKHIKI